MIVRTALAAALLLSAAPAGMAQAACTSPPPMATPINVPVGATVHVTPIDQNCNPIPNDPVTSKVSLLQATGVMSWALDGTGPGVNITGVAVGSAATVQFQWADQYATHAYVKSPTFTVNVVAPPPAVTAIGSSAQ
jgi:hypothetical protein